MTTKARAKPLLTPAEIKDMIRNVIATKGFDAFFDNDDVRNEIRNVVEVKFEEITDDDVQRVRDLLARARVTVTFGRGR